MSPAGFLAVLLAAAGPDGAAEEQAGAAAGEAHAARTGEGTADADAPTVTARPDRAEAKVGDHITLTVTTVSRRGVPVNLPAQVELEPFSVLFRNETEQDLGDGQIRREFTLVVAAYEPGETSIPPVEVTYLGRGGDVLTARSAAVPIKITSLLANEAEPQLKENAAPVAVLRPNLILAYGAAALGVAGAGALIATLVRRRLRARRAIVPTAPPRPAHEVALERLDRLGALGFAENVDHRPFYFAVSEVIREYLGARFGFDSLELTTGELMAELERRAPRELILSELQAWLSSSDLVKYAKMVPSATQARGTLEAAIRIVESTRPRPEPQVSVGDGSGEGGGAAASAPEPHPEPQPARSSPAGGVS